MRCCLLLCLKTNKPTKKPTQSTPNNYKDPLLPMYSSLQSAIHNEQADWMLSLNLRILIENQRYFSHRLQIERMSGGEGGTIICFSVIFTESEGGDVLIYKWEGGFIRDMRATLCLPTFLGKTCVFFPSLSPSNTLQYLISESGHTVMGRQTVLVGLNWLTYDSEQNLWRIHSLRTVSSRRRKWIC